MGSKRVVVFVVTALAVLGWMGLGACGVASPASAPATVHAGPGAPSPPAAVSLPVAAAPPSPAESQNPEANFVSHALAATRAAGLKPYFAYVPRPSATPAQVAEAAEKGAAAPLYTGDPAPMGLADYGLSVNGEAFVMNSYSDTVSVVDGATNTVLTTVPVGTGPYGAAYDSYDGNVYVANKVSNNVSVINGATDKVVDTIPVGSWPYSVAYDSSNGDVYVANDDSNNVSVINGATNLVVATIPVEVYPYSVTYDSGNGNLYVVNYGTNDVSVISGATNLVVATIPTNETAPEYAAYDSGNGDVYVTNSYSQSVSVISGTTNTLVGTIPVGSIPGGVAYDGRNGDVYVANDGSDTVSVIRGTTNTVVATIPVGRAPSAAAYDSQNGDVYVVNFYSDNASVISGATNKVVATVPVGTEPDGVAYDSGNGTAPLIPATVNTTSLQGYVDADATGIQGEDLYQSIPDGFSIQLNAVLTNITILGASGYEFWAQDIVTYFPAAGYMILVTNIWNYSAPGAPVSANAILTHGPYGHDDYAQLGYYYANYTVPYRVSYPFNVTLTMTSSLFEGQNEVWFSASVLSPTGAFRDLVMNNYDDVVFNSFSNATGEGADQPSNFTASAEGYNSAHLLDDFELDICGPGGGSQVDLGTADATLALRYLTGTNWSAPPSAYNYGSDTGETSIGANVAWSDTAGGSPNGITPYGSMTTGPSILSGLWGTGAPEGSYPIQISVFSEPTFAQLGNAFNFFLYNGSADFSAPIVFQYEYAPTMETSDFYLMPGTYHVHTELAGYTDRYNVLTVPKELGLNVTLTALTTLNFTTNTSVVYTPLWAFSNAEVAAIAQSGNGTPTDPYLLYNDQHGPLSSDFGLYNDYSFPVFPGVFLKDTDASVELNNSSTFETYTNDFQPSPGQVLPPTNELQFWFWNVTGVALVNDTNITGWFGLQDYFPLTYNSFNVVFYASVDNLVANDRFLTQSQGLLMYANGTLYGPPSSTGGNNTVWGNQFVQVTPPLGCPGPAACLPLLPYNSGLGVEIGEGYDLIYDNLVATPTTAWLLPLNLYTELPYRWTHDVWNVSSEPSSEISFAPGFPTIPLGGSVVGGSTQGGNSWWDYGVTENWANGADNPNGVLPYDENTSTLISPAQGYGSPLPGYPCPQYYCATYIYAGGDYAPLDTIAAGVSVAPQGLVGTTQWGAVVSCGPAKSGGAGPAKSGGAGPAKSGGAGPCSGVGGGGDPPALVLADFETTATSVDLVLPDGAFNWTPIVPAGYTSSLGGSFVVTAGTPATLSVPYAPPADAVLTFAESGLPSGLSWEVTVVGTSTSRTMSLTTDGGTDSLSFTEPMGVSYDYTITGIPGWEQTTLPYSGSVLVETAPTTEPTLVYISGPIVTVTPPGPFNYDLGQVPSALTATTTTYTGSSTVTLQWASGTSATCSLDTLMGSAVTYPTLLPSLRPSTASAGTTYYCVVVTETGTPSTTYYSNSAEVTVTMGPTVSVAPAGPISYDVGQTPSVLTATTTYAGPNSVTVEWYGSASSTCGAGSEGTGDSGVTFTPTTVSAGTTWYCAVVSDSGVSGYTSVSNAVKVTVTSDPTVSVASAEGPYDVGQTAAALTATVAYLGANPVAVQWYTSTTAATCSLSSSWSSAGPVGPSPVKLVPSTAVPGTTYYCAVATETGGAETTAASNVLTIVVFADPTVSVTPGTVSYGIGQTATAIPATVTYSGPNTPTVNWYASSSSATCVPTGSSLGTGTSYTPSTSTTGTTSYCAVITDSGVPSYSANSGSGVVTVSVVAAITVTPGQGPVGATVTVAGTGFSVSTTLKSLVFDGVTITSCTKGSLTTSGTGSFSCTFKVPSGTSGTSVVATNSGGQAAINTFKLTTPAITVTPGQGPVGATVTVAGTGFSVSTTLKSLVFDGVTITSCTSGSLTTSGTGSFSCTFKVPNTCKSQTTVTATDVGGQAATSTFKITTPAITMTPGQGPVGATVTVAGTGFSVSTTLKSLVFDGVTITSCTKGSLTTGGTGSFSCTFKVPSGTSGTTVTATDVGGQTASTKFTVT